MPKAKRASRPTVERLHELFALDRSTGRLFWKFRPDVRQPSWNTKFAGKQAGSLAKDGYIELDVDGQRYRAHVVIWAMCKGRWPADEIDHRDGVRDHNRLRNLREATPAEQRQNAATRSDNTSGFIGVTWDKRRQKWTAQIHMDGKHYQIGQFTTPEEAHEAYKAAKRKLHLFEPKVRTN